MLWDLIREKYQLPNNPNTKKWINHTANGIWKDNKSRVLKRAFDSAPNLEAAKAMRVRGVEMSDDTWKRCCDKFASITTQRGEEKSKSEKCRDARKSIVADHHWGRSSINAWLYKHREKLGKSPSIAEIYDKGYRRIDPLASESLGAGDNYQGISSNPEVCKISADLHKVYNDYIQEGSDQSTANSLALQQVMGKSKGLGLGSGSSTSRSRKSRMGNDPRDEQIRVLQEEMKTAKDALSSIMTFLEQQGHVPPTSTRSSTPLDEESEEDGNSPN